MRLPPHVESAVALGCYSFCSISMILLNKLILYTYNLNQPNALLFIQALGSVALVTGGKHLGLFTFPDFSMEVAKRWIVLTVLFSAMLLTSMKSLFTMSVPALTVLKNIALILTALGDQYFYGRDFPLTQYGAFVLIIIGGYLNAKGDQWVTPIGLMWTFLNIVSTVSYTLYIKQLTNRFTDLGRYGPVFYNNLLSLPFFFVMALPEFSPFAKGVGDSSAGAVVAIVVVTVVSSSMTFCVFWCVAVTSPTSFSVMGAFNKIPTAAIGMLIFAQYPDRIGFVGLAVALAGSFLYTGVSMHAKRKEKQHSVERPSADAQEEIVVKSGKEGNTSSH